MVVIDSKRIRQKAHRDFQRATRELNNARAESERFHAQDKPLFIQWLNANFGGLLTELRALQEKLFEAQQLVNEVQEEYHFGNHASITSAYKAVLHRREHPEEDEEESTDEEPSESEAAADEFTRAFEEFQERFHQLGAGRTSDHSSKSPARLKDLYRKLARRLHPDNGRELTPRETDLWHQTQAAYEKGEVEVLETIFAMLEVDERGSKDAPVSTLLQLTASLKLSLRSLKRELSALRRDVAWNFSRSTDRSALVHATEQTLHADREKLLWLLTKYQAQIERWEAQARFRGKRVQSRRTNWMDEEWF